MPDTPQPLPYFTPSIKSIVTFHLRQGTSLADTAGNDVRDKLLELFPKAAVSFNADKLIVELAMTPDDLIAAKATFDRMYSVMFMRVNYGRDGAVLEAILDAHPELRAVPDLGRLLVSFNALLNTVGDITKSLEPADAPDVLSDQQLNTLEPRRFGDREAARAENEGGAMRDVTTEQAANLASNMSAANRLRSAPARPVTGGPNG